MENNQFVCAIFCFISILFHWVVDDTLYNKYTPSNNIKTTHNNKYHEVIFTMLKHSPVPLKPIVPARGTTLWLNDFVTP
jgi:hypothetical protein